ncbi:MAG: DUF3667 domain-containing protein [Burkholderiales bacterium]|jgi:hypothetical protein|nr:DUF3667 domain-containing protein [Burkholderiales bacterium]
MSHPAHPPELPYCRNCHFTLATPRPVYCGHCGQETDLHPPSVREMFTEYLGHYVAFDGPLWRTLWALVCLPGHLTNAYFHGQRRRYVLPLRIYLSASFVFFVGSHLLPHAEAPDDAEEQRPGLSVKPAESGRAPVRVNVRPNESPLAAAASATERAGGKPAPLVGDLKLKCKTDAGKPCSRTEAWLDAHAAKASAMTREQWTTRMTAAAPYGMLALQPIFAALLLALFAGSGRRYAEHFVFSLHCHSLWFLALLLAMATGFDALVSLAVFGHGLVALRRVYTLGWFGAVWRGLLLSIGYFALLGLAAGGLVALIFVTA